MLAWLLVACGPKSPTPHDPSPTTPTTPATPPAPQRETVLVVSSYWSGQVMVFDPATGERLGTVQDLPGAQTVVEAADGRWVACAELANKLVIVDPVTFEVVEDLVADDPATPEDETGGLQHPDTVTFGPDGRLYVASFETDEILRYEADGTFVDVMVAAGAGGLDGPDLGLMFGPTGELWVVGWYSDRVHRYDGATGAPLGDLLGPDQGLLRPRAVRADAAGNVFVSSWQSGVLLRMDGATGEVTEVARRPTVTGLALDEVRGEILLGDDSEDTVRAYALETGEDLGVRVDFGPLDGVTAVNLLTRPADP